MKKVSELTGAELDYWVAKADGDNPCIEDGKCMVIVSPGAMAGNETHRFYFQPSVDWRLGGPIIEREEIAVRPSVIPGAGWVACLDHGGFEQSESPLIAAMRAFVSSHFGDEVPNE